MTKEEIYDEQINPLMAQIIAICKEHNIAHVCTFDCGDGLLCTTCLTTDEAEPPETYRRLVDVLFPKSEFAMLTVRDGDGKATASIAIVD